MENTIVILEADKIQELQFEMLCAKWELAVRS